MFCIKYLRDNMLLNHVKIVKNENRSVATYKKLQVLTLSAADSDRKQCHF